MADINLGIQLDGKQAEKALKSLTRDAQSSSKKMTEAFNASTVAFGSFVGTLSAGVVSSAFRGMSDAASALFSTFVTEGVAAAKVQEDAINDLNIALRRGGEFSQETSRDLQDFASQLQATSKFGDEAVLSQLAFAQSMGASAEQSKVVLRAATDLAASLNIDLNSATRNVAKTLGGYAGELGEVIPELKTLTQEQLRAGEGVELLAKKFAGAATGQINTFSGATAQLSNTFGDLQEKTGEVITQNPAILAGIKSLNGVFVQLQGVVEANKDAIGQFIVNFGVGLIEAIPGVISGFNTVLNIFSALKQAFREVTARVTAIILTLNEGALAYEEFIGRFTDNSEAINALKEQNKALEEFGTKQFEAIAQEDKAAGERAEAFKRVEIAARNAGASIVKSINDSKKAQEEAAVVDESAAKKAVATTAPEEDPRIKKEMAVQNALKAIREQAAIDEEQRKINESIANEEEDELVLERILALEERKKALKTQFSSEELAAAQANAKERKKIEDQQAKDSAKGLGSLFDFEKNTNAGRAANFKASLNTISTLQSQSNSTLFGIGKAAAISTATIDGIAAVQKALASAPPPFSFAIAAAVGVATAANIAKISSAKPPSRQTGGLLPGAPSPTDTGLFRGAPGELVLNRRQQTNLFNSINRNDLGAGGNQVSLNIQGNVIGNEEFTDGLIQDINNAIEFRNADARFA